MFHCLFWSKYVSYETTQSKILVFSLKSWSFLHKPSKMTVNLVKLQQEDRVICGNKSADLLLLEKLVRN